MKKESLKKLNRKKEGLGNSSVFGEVSGGRFGVLVARYQAMQGRHGGVLGKREGLARVSTFSWGRGGGKKVEITPKKNKKSENKGLRANPPKRGLGTIRHGG